MHTDSSPHSLHPFPFNPEHPQHLHPPTPQPPARSFNRPNSVRLAPDLGHLLLAALVLFCEAAGRDHAVVLLHKRLLCRLSLAPRLLRASIEAREGDSGRWRKGASEEERERETGTQGTHESLQARSGTHSMRKRVDKRASMRALHSRSGSRVPGPRLEVSGLGFGIRFGVWEWDGQRK
eukprot:2147686-Rhodomonas_salina.1